MFEVKFNNLVSVYFTQQEAEEALKYRQEKHKDATLTIKKLKILICDSVIQHKFKDYDYYVDDSLSSISVIIKSLLLGKDHISLHKLNDSWTKATDVVDVYSLLNNDFSLESILYHGFGQIYPQSNFLSRYTVSLLDDYDLKKITKENITKEFNKIIKLSFCKTQKEILTQILEKYVN